MAVIAEEQQYSSADPRSIRCAGTAFASAQLLGLFALLAQNFLANSPGLGRRDAIDATLISLCLTGIIWAKRPVAITLAPYILLTCAIPLAILSPWSYCLDCTASGNSSQIVWILGMAWFGAAIVATFLNAAPTVHRIVGTLSVIAAISQVALQFVWPKFCPACLFLSVAFQVVAFSCFSGRLQQPLAIQRVSLVVFVVPLLISVASTFKIWPAPPRSQEVKNHEGKQIDSIVQAEGPIADGLVIATLPGCNACGQAEADLRQAQIRFKSIPLCSIASGTPCVERSEVTIAPTFFIVVNGRIRRQATGWPVSESFAQEVTDSSAFLHKLKSARSD